MNNQQHTKHNFGLIGKHLAHSFSERYFTDLFRKSELHDCHYSLYEISTLDHLHQLIADRRLDGFNVTIPYKVDIIPMLDSIDTVAQQIGAVNTVVVERRGVDIKLHGFNTDAPAFGETLQPLLKPHHRNALILGTGGASKAVAWALQGLKISFKTVSRTPANHPGTIDYDEAEHMAVAEPCIIINATPAGMFPDCNMTPWPHDNILTTNHLCYDLVYNPSPTLFMRQASERGATVCDGLAMLHRQADLAFELFISEKF